MCKWRRVLPQILGPHSADLGCILLTIGGQKRTFQTRKALSRRVSHWAHAGFWHFVLLRFNLCCSETKNKPKQLFITLSLVMWVYVNSILCMSDDDDNVVLMHCRSGFIIGNGCDFMFVKAVSNGVCFCIHAHISWMCCNIMHSENKFLLHLVVKRISDAVCILYCM